MWRRLLLDAARTRVVWHELVGDADNVRVTAPGVDRVALD
jgi:hypothetical protein